jgi:hypothetical protein
VSLEVVLIADAKVLEGASVRETRRQQQSKCEGRVPTSAHNLLMETRNNYRFTVRKQFRNCSNTHPSAAIAAIQTANAAVTTHCGATPTRRNRNGRKFHVVM